MKRKHIFWWALFGVVILALGVMGVRTLVSPSDLPSGVSTTTPPVSVVPTTEKPKPTTTTVTATVTVPPVTTANTITVTAPPPLPPAGCVQNDLNTADWDMTDDNSDRGNYANADGKIAALAPTTGECYDTIVLTVYDDLRNNPVLHPDLADDDPMKYEWVTFLSGYIDDGEMLMHDPVGSVVPTNSAAVLHLTVLAHAEAGDLLPKIDDGNLSEGVPPLYRFDAGSDFVSLNEVLWAGSFESTTSFGLGVNGKTPYAVHYGRVTLDVTEVIIHVAHK